MQVVRGPVVCGFGQHTGTGESQFRAGFVTAAAVTRAIGDLACLPVGVDVVQIRLDMDSVAANDPVKAAGAHVRLGLAVALNYGRETGAFVAPLHAGVDDLLHARRSGRVDHDIDDDPV